MVIQQYTPEQIALANKFLSPDAFLYVVMDALAKGKGLSVVGFGDGERSVMLYARGKQKAHYLNDAKYLAEYGLTGANLKTIGEDLYKAANEADYFCPLIHGIYLPAFDCIRICDPREVYVERLYPYAWVYMGRERELMKCSRGIAVVCRNSIKVATNLQNKYSATPIHAIEYTSWHDYDKALEGIRKSGMQLILCAVGQSGKNMIVEAAKKYNKVVLDIGSALINKWQA